MNNSTRYNAIFTGTIADQQTQDLTQRTQRIFTDTEHLSNLARKWKNVHADKAQGHMFEQLEVIKFNFDALKKDSDIYAQTTASMGLPTDPVDIVIKRGNETIREIQAKSCNSAARSTFALSSEKYREMQRLAPSDQHSEIERLLKKRIEAGTLKAEDYEQTLRNLKKSLSHDEIASTGTQYKEAFDATNPDLADKIANQYKLDSALIDIHKSGMKAGKIGACVSGGLTALTESYSVIKGEKELSKAVIDTAISSAKGYATGYAVTALSKGITHTTSHFLGETISKSLTRSNAHVAIAAGVVNSAKSITSYINGEIEFENLSNEISHTAITSTSSFYYGAAGQMLIPIPVVGALVGSSVGYLVGNLIYQSGLLALGDDNILVNEAKERRRQIEQLCLQVIPQIQEHRRQLEIQITQNNELRKQGIDFGFNLIQNAIESTDPEIFILGLNKIGEQFGIILPYQDFDKFDHIMKSNEAFVF
ncbi:hypothetical protein [Photobacterium leiognathi]|uniref:hypothetical protein n=1 Tax=Photobacterium leiognathi TaxID=553611 RepID=UPI002980FAF0|nr:hypothetical protein [Photobacterium leiognathi]